MSENSYKLSPEEERARLETVISHRLGFFHERVCEEIRDTMGRSIMDMVKEGDDPEEAIMGLAHSDDPGKRQELFIAMSRVKAGEIRPEIASRIFLSCITDGHVAIRKYSYEKLWNLVANNRVLDNEWGFELIKGLNEVVMNLDADSENVNKSEILDRLELVLIRVCRNVFEVSERSIDADICKRIVELAEPALKLMMNKRIEKISSIHEGSPLEVISQILTRMRSVAHVLALGESDFNFTDYIQRLWNVARITENSYVSVNAEDSLMALAVEDEELDDLRRNSLLVFMRACNGTFTEQVIQEWERSGDDELIKWAEDLRATVREHEEYSSQNFNAELILKSGFAVPWEIRKKLAVVDYGSRNALFRQVLVDNLSNDQKLELFKELWVALSERVDNQEEIIDHYLSISRGEMDGAIHGNIVHDQLEEISSDSLRISWEWVIEEIVLPLMGNGFEEFFEQWCEEVAADGQLSEYTYPANYYFYNAVVNSPYRRHLERLLPLIHEVGFAMPNNVGELEHLDRAFIDKSVRMVYDPEMIPKILGLELITGGRLSFGYSDQGVVNYFQDLYEAAGVPMDRFFPVSSNDNYALETIGNRIYVLEDLMRRCTRDVIAFFRELLENSDDWFLRFKAAEYLNKYDLLSDDDLEAMKSDSVGAISTMWLRDYAFSDDRNKLDEVMVATSAGVNELGCNLSLAAVDALISRVNSEDEERFDQSAYIVGEVLELPDGHWVKKEFLERVDVKRFSAHSWQDEWEDALY